MSVYRRGDSPFYHYDFQYRGERFHGSTQATDRRSAEAVEKAIRDKLKRQAAISVSGTGPRMTLDGAVGRYWDEVGQHSNENDLEKNLERLISLFGEATLLSDIDDNELAVAVARRRRDLRPAKGGGTRPISVARVNRTVTELLRRVLTRARKVWKVPLANEPDWAAHILKEPNERIRELSFTEEDAVAEAERNDYRPPRLFAQATLLRRREVVTLSWQQVDWGAGLITVVQKGEQPHTVPITEEISAILWPLRGHHETAVFTYVAQRTRRCAKSGRVFEKGKRYPITYEGFGTHFRRSLEQAGVTNFRLHDLRHTGATRTLRASKNIRAVQEMLGHADVKTTMRYAHAMKDDVAEAMAARVEDEARRRSMQERDRESREIPEAAETTAKIATKRRG